MTEIENFINFDKLDRFDEDRNFNLNVNVEDFINSNHHRNSNHSSYDNNDVNGDNLNQLNILSDIYVDSQHQQPLSINVKDLQNSNYSGEVKSEAVEHDNDDDNDNENENVDYSSDSNSTIPSQSSSNNVNSKDSKLKNSNTNSSNKRRGLPKMLILLRRPLRLTLVLRSITNCHLKRNVNYVIRFQQERSG